MLNRSSLVPHARGLGKLRQVVAAMKSAALMERSAPRRWPGRRWGEEAGSVLLLAAILVTACAYLLLMDLLGVSPAVATDLPLAD